MIFLGMSNVKISILLTVYDNIEYLNECLQSIQSQSYNNWELIIWNDNPSSNDADKIVNDFIYNNGYKNTILYIKNSENIWIVKNLQNLYINKSKDSYYIAVMECDDLRYDSYLEDKITVAESQNIWLIYSSFDVINSKWDIIENNLNNQKYWFLQFKNIYEQIIYGHNIFSYSNLFIKNIILNEIWWFMDNIWKKNMISDWDLYFRYLKKYSALWIDKVNRKYRIHDSNFSMQTPWLVKQLWKNISSYNVSKLWLIKYVLLNIHNILLWVIKGKVKKIDLFRIISFIWS